MTLYNFLLTHTLPQYLRTKRRGLPAFRKMIAKPILQDIGLQDVVFANGAGDNVNAYGAADRALATKISDLDVHEKQLERQEIASVRAGCKHLNNQTSRHWEWGKFEWWRKNVWCINITTERPWVPAFCTQ